MSNNGFQRQPQHFTFDFDPAEVSGRFDPIFDQHLANFRLNPPSEPPNITLSLAKNHLAGIHQKIQQLRQQCAALTESATSSTMSDQQRQNVYDDLTAQHRQIDVQLAAASSADSLRTIRELARKRRNKRKRVKELRLQKRQQPALQSIESPAESNSIATLDAIPTPDERAVGNQNNREHHRAKQANTYLVLCERLVELHRVRCQQVTRRPDATFLAEIATLERLWSEAAAQKSVEHQ